MIQVLIILGAISFCAPFIIWMVVRFLDKQRQRPMYYKKQIIGFSFLVCFLLMILFLGLSIALSL
ncbi:hypothetical protein STIUS_v1c01760 [Spiroplasma sp. TIUS-1]|uniref:hypothetical protein n=1 Tax=Spiroplasma sp. TIUS-1 TaxID=216963 RepID=UPI0013991DDE|nr:hypothetical protein [Spiroplasma sp. TIUS-1]QHX35731.1 hypothetical protein STIUS_v1c01760 [Spiroplasma sp. TIUS-1]